MSTLFDIRMLIEREVKETVTNEDVIMWCNQVNMDLGMDINISAAPALIPLTSTDMEYPLPADLKIINRLRLQSVIDEGLDREFGIGYRIYNGKIILPRILWIVPDTLVIEYYKHLSTFTDIGDAIDVDARFNPVYALYGVVKFRGDDPENNAPYQNMKNQVRSYYSLSNEPVILDGRW